MENQRLTLGRVDRGRVSSSEFNESTSSLLSFFNPICSLLQNLPASNFDLSEELADGQFAWKGTTTNTVGNYFDDASTVYLNIVSNDQVIFVILNFQERKSLFDS